MYNTVVQWGYLYMFPVARTVPITVRYLYLITYIHSTGIWWCNDDIIEWSGHDNGIYFLSSLEPWPNLVWALLSDAFPPSAGVLAEMYLVTSCIHWEREGKQRKREREKRKEPDLSISIGEERSIDIRILAKFPFLKNWKGWSWRK